MTEKISASKFFAKRKDIAERQLERLKDKVEDFVETEIIRGQWSNKIEFFLSTIGYVVGLGNIWRFPYMVYLNGGGSFLLACFVMLLLVGIPLVFMELALGQFSACGPTKLFGRISPLFEGLGLSMISATFILSIYYIVVLAWSIFFMFTSFQSDLPWSHCTNYSSHRCLENLTGVRNEGSSAKWSPTEEYFNTVVLGYVPDYTSWSNFGTPRWQIVSCLFAAWLVVCLSLLRGIQSSGKVVYFTAVFPMMMTVIFLIYGLTLDGATVGILYYISPNFEKLSDFNVWSAAATQIFFTLGPAYGGLITMSSYNKFNNNCHRDAIVISVVDFGFCIISGFSVFSVLGFMAKTLNKEISEVAVGDIALAFIVYPEAVSIMPVPQLWSVLFFLMLITLGIDSMFTLVETIVTSILDHFNDLRLYKHWVVGSVCFIGFLCGLTMCCPGGILMFTLLHKMSTHSPILIFAFLEVALVSWVYGSRKFLANIEQMRIAIPKYLKIYWLVCWTIVTPVVLLLMVVHSFFSSTGVEYDDIQFPDEIVALGVLVAVVTVLFFPLTAAYRLFRKFKKSEPIGEDFLQPTSRWVAAKDDDDSSSIQIAVSLL